MGVCKLNESQIEDVCRLYIDGNNSIYISSIYKVSSVTILNILKRNNIKIRSKKECRYKSDLDETVFDTITEESAYWIGFLMADGCVVKLPHNSTSISLCLSEKDSDHIILFKNFLKSSRKIYIRKYFDGRLSSGISVRSDYIADKLGTYGVVPRKSKSAKAEIVIDNRHFWRGVVDGDGCISIRKYKNGPEYPNIQLCGSYNLMNQFSDFIYNNINIKLNVNTVSSIFKIDCTGLKAAKIIDLLYRDCNIGLNRKVIVANNIIEKYC